MERPWPEKGGGGVCVSLSSMWEQTISPRPPKHQVDGAFSDLLCIVC